MADLLAGEAAAVSILSLPSAFLDVSEVDEVIVGSVGLFPVAQPHVLSTSIESFRKTTTSSILPLWLAPKVIILQCIVSRPVLFALYC